MRVAVNNHQNKGTMLINALTKHGHEVVGRDEPAEILLIDTDIPVAFYERTIEAHVMRGAQVYVYQHGANPVIVFYDGIWPVSDRVNGYFCMAKGAKAVMEAYGYPHPIHVIGWHYCPIKPWQPNGTQRVLFAPWHPHGNGYLHPVRREKNGQIFEELADLPLDLTVRHIRTLHQNGLPPEQEGIKYVKGHLDTTFEDIDNADVVVSVGTFACMALARGKPVVWFGQDLRPVDGFSDRMLKYVRSWPKYRDMIEFPYHWPDEPFENLLPKALKEPVWWKSQFIGEQFDGAEFVGLLEELYERNKSNI